MPYITDELKDFDKQVIRYASKFKSKATPTNLYQIQQKILNSDKGGNTPLKKLEEVGILGFSYQHRERSYQEPIDGLKNLDLPSGPFKKLYKHKIDESTKKLQMLESLGKNEFTSSSEALYGAPNSKLIDKAYSLLELPESEVGEKFNAQKAKRLLQKYLTDFKMDWKISTKKLLGYALISPSKKTVTLSSNHMFTESTIKRLAVHEIGTHGTRYLNAKMQPLRIFKNFPGYLATEEGLAAFNEELSGYLNNTTLKRYAGRVIAVDYAKDHTLLETYDFLKGYFDQSDAINIAMRVKRGLPNSESMGSYTKDHVYLKGFIDVKDYVKKNPLKYLYYGKINMDYLKLIKKVEPELTKVKHHPLLVVNFDKKSELF